MPTLADLPEHARDEIFEHAGLISKIVARSVCREWRALVNFGEEEVGDYKGLFQDDDYLRDELGAARPKFLEYLAKIGFPRYTCLSIIIRRGDFGHTRRWVENWLPMGDDLDLIDLTCEAIRANQLEIFKYLAVKWNERPDPDELKPMLYGVVNIKGLDGPEGSEVPKGLKFLEFIDQLWGCHDSASIAAIVNNSLWDKNNIQYEIIQWCYHQNRFADAWSDDIGIYCAAIKARRLDILDWWHGTPNLKFYDRCAIQKAVTKANDPATTIWVRKNLGL
jgi:F-box domain